MAYESCSLHPLHRQRKPSETTSAALTVKDIFSKIPEAFPVR